MKTLCLASITTAAALLACSASAQSVVLSSTKGLTFIEGTQTASPSEPTAAPTGPYVSYTGRITLTAASGATTKTITGIEGSKSTVITGVISSVSQSTIVSNHTATSKTPRPTNTQPCNNYVELCSRKYSNVTFIGAHNSPFVRPGNSGSNQEFPVTTQLDDGVRFLQAQMQFPSNSSVPHFCHTTCDLLDAGPITDWLSEVASWVDAHPYDVVTIILENGNYSEPSVYAPYIQQSGILKYAYEPPYLPMSLDDWPTLESMIVRGKRVVLFLDYMADPLKYPWLLDEFSQVWETPFDPVDRDFPCNVQRPPDLSNKAAKDRLYLMNHNLNADFQVFGLQLLVPAVSLLNETNAMAGFGSLGLAANNCMAEWGRAPNILNIDYYNFGDFPGSVFETAAMYNNVTYKNGSCCGTTSGAGSATEFKALPVMFLATILSVVFILQ